MNEAICLNNDMSPLCDGMLPNWVKIVSFILPSMDDLMQDNIAFESWMDLLLVQEVLAAVISA